MGLFSSKKKTIVGLTTVPLIPEQKIFNESVLGAIFSNTSIASALSAELRNGWLGKANYFYRQTKSKLSTKSGTAVFSSFTSNTSLDSILENIFGFPVVVYKYAISSFDVTYNAYNYIIANYTLNPETDEVIIGAETVTFTSAFVANGLLNIVFKKVDESELVITTEDYLRSENEYFHLVYAKKESPEELAVWLYDTTTNSYPEITDKIFTESYNDYYPSIIIRKDKNNTIDNDDDYNKYSKRILNKMGLDIEYLTEQLLTNEEGQSDVVDDAFVTFGLNIQDKYEGSIKYLYEYFYRIYLDIPDSKSKFFNWVDNPLAVKPEYSIKYINDGFNSYIEWNYISYEIKSGSLETDYTRETQINGTSVGLVNGVSVEYDSSKFILRKKLNDNQYAEIIIDGLYHATEIIKGKIVIRTLEDSLNIPNDTNVADSAFYIPLSKTIVDKLSFIEKKQVLYAAFTVPIYTVQIVKIKWYQRGAFKILLYIIAIIVTIVTVDFSGSAFQIAVAIASNIVTNIIISRLLQIAVDIIGIENALILAIIATAVAIYNGGYSPNGLPWAQELLMYATLSFNAIGAEIQNDFVKLQNEISDFLLDAREAQEQLENAAALLDNSKYSLLDLTSGRMYFNPYETPDQFYERSAYNQNPGVKTYDMLYNYVERMLKLPEHTNF